MSLLALLLASELLMLLVHARDRLLWYDEVLTVYVSGLQPFSRLWSALLAGVDGMPPGYYLFVRLAALLPVPPGVFIRVPSIIGYLLTLLGVFWFTRKRWPASAGLAAVILIILSPFRDFAVEGRSYTLMVGFLAISAVLWQRVGEHRFIPLTLALLLSLAVSCHHLAIMSLLPFGAAEIMWTLHARRIRVGVWAGFAWAATPFFAGLPILLGYRANYGNTFWSRPTWADVLMTYGNYIGLNWYLVLVLIALYLLTAGVALVKIARSPVTAANTAGLSAPEILLVGGFLLYPALIVALAVMAGSGYVFRYGWPGLLGLVWAFVFGIGPTWWRRKSGHLVSALLITVAFVGIFEAKMHFRAPTAGYDLATRRWNRLAALTESDPTLPVVISDGMGFLQATVYGPRALRDRVIGISCPEIAIRMFGNDTVDRTNRQLSQFVPIPLESLAPFLTRHSRFHLYSGGLTDWITRYLVESGYKLQLVSLEDGGSLYVAER